MGNNQDEIKQECPAEEQTQPKPKKKNKRGLIITIVIAVVLVAVCATGAIANEIINNQEVCKKPIIYIYPESEMNVNVELGYPERLTCVYPGYNDHWDVIAKPNGDLIDIATGRNLYALYYESELVDYDRSVNTGFVVAKKDTVSFLEDKLAYLGLNEREAEEFIVYWLPQLQKSNYNLIRFATPEEIERNMPITVTPSPDTMIRVLMLFEGLDRPINVIEQELTQCERNGYTVVEWGGAEVDLTPNDCKAFIGFRPVKPPTIEIPRIKRPG